MVSCIPKDNYNYSDMKMFLHVSIGKNRMAYQVRVGHL